MGIIQIVLIFMSLLLSIIAFILVIIIYLRKNKHKFEKIEGIGRLCGDEVTDDIERRLELLEESNYRLRWEIDFLQEQIDKVDKNTQWFIDNTKWLFGFMAAICLAILGISITILLKS